MSTKSLQLKVGREVFPIRGSFRISRGAKTEAEVLVCTIVAQGVRGHGECVPYKRYGETLDSVEEQIKSVFDAETIEELDAKILTLPAGAARNALDCAMWDWKAKKTNVRVDHQICDVFPSPIETAYTLSLDTPSNMAEAARSHAGRSLIKIKLGGNDDIACMHAVTANAPYSRIIIDANEAWTSDNFAQMMREAAHLKIALIEQPLPAGNDALLAKVPHPVPICADESVHTTAELKKLTGKYDFINIKLDKTGGLTEAVKMKTEARALGFGIMVGCMVGSSLAMAPAVLLAQGADFVDLDGPLLLAKDRSPALSYMGNTVSPPSPELWG